MAALAKWRFLAACFSLCRQYTFWIFYIWRKYSPNSHSIPHFTTNAMHGEKYSGWKFGLDEEDSWSPCNNDGEDSLSWWGWLSDMLLQWDGLCSSSRPIYSHFVFKSWFVEVFAGCEMSLWPAGTVVWHHSLTITNVKSSTRRAAAAVPPWYAVDLTAQAWCEVSGTLVISDRSFGSYMSYN